MGALTALFARRRQPDIVKQALAFRRDLIRGNDAALREMARVHMATWKRLRSQFDQMSRQIAAATEELGGLEAVRDLHPSWIFRQQRYADLMWQCEQELLYFTRAAAAQVRMQQTAAMQLGQQHAFRLVDAQMPRELTGTWNRMPVEALQDLVGVLQDGSPLSYKFAGLAEETAAGIKETIAAGFAQGWNPRKIAREIKRSYDGALTNALLTCRTETMRAYRGAAHASYQANSDVVDGWIRVAAKNGRSCIACLAQDGTFHPLTERLHDHPAGRCVAIPHTRPWNELFPGLDLSGVKETSVQPWNAEDSFKRLSEADQRRMMGGAKFRLWKEGKISLSDLATKQRSKVWGDHYRPTTLKELVARGKVTRDEAKWASKRQTAAEPGSGDNGIQFEPRISVK